MDFEKVFEIFPELDTQVLCQLSEMEEILPSEVYKLAPGASAVQITAFLRLAKTHRVSTQVRA